MQQSHGLFPIAKRLVSLVLLVVNLHTKFRPSSFSRSRDYRRGPKIPKNGHVDPLANHFDQILHFTMVTLVINLRAKFEVSSFIIVIF